MVEVVAGLEATAGDLACRHVTDGEIEAIAATHQRMLDAWRAGDDRLYFTLNREIHEAIMAASRNATLQGIYANLSGRIQRARYTAHKTPEQWAKASPSTSACWSFAGRGRRRLEPRPARAHSRQEAPHRRGLRLTRRAGAGPAGPPAAAPSLRGLR
jgi:hypothetical protein